MEFAAGFSRKVKLEGNNASVIKEVSFLDHA